MDFKMDANIASMGWDSKEGAVKFIDKFGDWVVLVQNVGAPNFAAI